MNENVMLIFFVEKDIVLVLVEKKVNTSFSLKSIE